MGKVVEMDYVGLFGLDYFFDFSFCFKRVKDMKSGPYLFGNAAIINKIGMINEKIGVGLSGCSIPQ